MNEYSKIMEDASITPKKNIKKSIEIINVNRKDLKYDS